MRPLLRRLATGTNSTCGNLRNEHYRQENAMSDDRTKTGFADSMTINVDERYEVSYWAAQWGIAEATLRQAVKSVGVQVDDVRRYLENDRVRRTGPVS